MDHVPGQGLPVAVKGEADGSSLGESSTRVIEHKMKVDTDTVNAEPPVEQRAVTPPVIQAQPVTGNTASVTFAIPSPELSPAPSLPPDEPSAETLTGDGFARTRSASVMTAPGGATADAEGAGLSLADGTMLTGSDIGNLQTGMDELSEAMMAEAAAQGRVVLQGRGRPYLRAKKPLKDVLRKVLADIRRKDSVSPM
jgi:hypothetical protein